MTTDSQLLSDRIETLNERLHRYAKRHANETMSADDLYQIAVEEILSHCSPTDNDTYMLRLADWRMKNAIKRERTYSIRINAVDIDGDDEEDGFQIGDPNSTPEEESALREVTQKIKEIIGGMKPEYKTIIEMLGDGKNAYDIAEVIGTSYQNVYYHIKKIRETFVNAGLTPSLVMA